jgi:hypothetical protein
LALPDVVATWQSPEEASVDSTSQVASDYP